MGGVIITPVDDNGKISQQSFLVKKSRLQARLGDLYNFTLHILAMVGLVTVIGWFV